MEKNQVKVWTNFICKDCGHLVVARDLPASIRWTDGHVCRFVEEENFCVTPEKK